MMAAAVSAVLALLVAVSAERQLRFRGGRALAFVTSAALATAAGALLTGTLGLAGLLGAIAGAAGGLALGRRPG